MKKKIKIDLFAEKNDENGNLKRTVFDIKIFTVFRFLWIIFPQRLSFKQQTIVNKRKL